MDPVLLFRKVVIEQKIFGPDLIISADKKLLSGLIVIPLFWLLLNFIAGFYSNPQRKSRLSDLGLTLMITLTGTIILFFALINSRGTQCGNGNWLR